MKIISGGQTGVDRAALDVAIEQGIDYGGYIPKGRKAEDGRISEKYSKLIETKEVDYKSRTELNVKKASATLIIFKKKLFGGTLLSKELAIKHNKPYLRIDIDKKIPKSEEQIKIWIKLIQPGILNIAGSRESNNPGIYETTKGLLTKVFKQVYGR